MHLSNKENMLRNLTAFLAGDTSALSDLRPHQKETLETIKDFLVLETGAEFIQRGVESSTETGSKLGDFFEVVSATGTGKTRMLGTMAMAMDVPTLILTPRKILNDQTRREFCEEIGIPVEQVAVFDSNQDEEERRRVLTSAPQFLITTYQSLPSLQNRHGFEIDNPQNLQHYRPLVILDEVHEARGKLSTPVKKLLGKVLVTGFTATDGNASQNIFNRQKPIYHLPIVPAIKRHLLCTGIRTGVIDVAINEQWVDDFARTKEGKDYSPKQLERFARTPSVTNGALNFHLGYKDEESEEIHQGYEDEELGKISRLPTIFYTQGVNAAREGAEAYNERARQLGLDVKAAYVSGDMDPELCHAILDRFKRGEIHALWNDRLLGMGFDAPNATVCYSLQPSNVPDMVEQQLGRVARRQGEDYLEKYKQNKVALAINVRGAGMNPILYSQILGGPSVYSDQAPQRPASQPGKTPGEQVSPALEWPDMKVHIDYNDMLTVFADANKAREDTSGNPLGLLTIEEMSALTGKAQATISPMYIDAKEAWERAKGESLESFTVPFGKQQLTIRIDQAGNFIGRNGRSVFGLHKDVAEQIGIPDYPLKTKEWLGTHEMAARARKNRSAISDLYDKAKIAWDLAKGAMQQSFTVPFEAGQLAIRTSQAGMFRNRSGKNAFCLHEDMAAQIGTPGAQKTDEWLGINEMATLLRKAGLTVTDFYERAEAAWQQAKDNTLDSFTVMFERKRLTIPVGKAGRFGGKNYFCLHRDVAVEIGIPRDYPAKTETYLSRPEMALQLGYSDHKRLAPLYSQAETAWQQAVDNARATFTINHDMIGGDLTLRTEQATFCTYPRGPVRFCFRQDVADILRGRIVRLPASHTERVGRRSVRPDSEHLKPEPPGEEEHSP